MKYSQLKERFSKESDLHIWNMLRSWSLYVATTLLEIVDRYKNDANITWFDISYEYDDSTEYEIRRIELNDIYVDWIGIFDDIWNSDRDVSFMVNEYDEIRIDLQNQLDAYEREFTFLIWCMGNIANDNIDVSKLERYLEDVL